MSSRTGASSKTRVGKYELGRTLGERSFAEVKFGKNIETEENVAIKIVDKEKFLKFKMIGQVMSKFSPFIGSTITGISMGLGPDGELRYPSHQKPAKSGTITGVGEFQCYDANMLNLLKQHAEASGNPLWGLGGPHDTPTYDQSPNSNSFFKDHSGSWEGSYGDFFLSWYTSELISYGNRLLSLASSIFGDTEVNVYGKIPLI